MDPELRTHDGLDGIAVAETELSHVDGERGQLILRGVGIERLAPNASVEDVCHLLWHGKLPDAGERERMRERLYHGRARAFALLPGLGDALTLPDPMDALRAATAHLTEDAGDDAAALLVGAVAVFAAAHARLSAGEPPVVPSEHLDHAADYLRMVRGDAAPAPLVRALTSYLVTVSDHGMNASTFTARVVASTGSDLVSAVVAAIGALKGPLHGGSPGPVLDMLDAIATPDNAEAWLRGELDARRRIMGMGHRVYRVRDPRAAVLEAALHELARHAPAGARLELARAVEHEAARLLDERHPGRALRANVEFNTAVLLETIGLHRSLFSPTFAVARVVGWCAHVAEQRTRGRLIRPNARYIGSMPV
jgi:citrate synthase